MKSFVHKLLFCNLILLVSVRVKSVCIEEDCTDQSIKVVDLASGQCITCFPCPQCVDGQTPSVPCGTTVPPGTDIHCIRTTPDPVVVSKASAYTTALTLLLATSPSVTSLHSSRTRTKHITVVPAVKSHTHLMVVFATSSKNYNGGSSTLAVNIDFEDLETHRGKTAEDHKMGDRTVVAISCSVTLVAVVVGVLCRLWKRKTVEISEVHVNSQTPPMSRDSCSGTSYAGNNGAFVVDVYPETNSAWFLRSYPEGDQQATEQGNDNEHFQHHLASPEETIPSSLHVTHAEGNQPHEINQDSMSDDKSLDPPNHPKTTNKDQKHLINAGSNQPHKVNQDSTSEDKSLIDFSLDPQDQLKKRNKDPKPLINAGREEKPKESRPITLASKDQSTSITGLHQPTNILTEVPQEFQNRLLSRKMTKIPFEFYRKICNKLDKLREIFWDDFRMLGEGIGLEKDEVLLLEQIGSPTDKMMRKFDSQRDSSIGKFRDIVEGMGRDDVVSVINEWILHEFKSKCTDMLV